MSKTAIFWIRDGVLIDRMAVNAVAFAFACLHLQDGKESASLTDLINFAFEASGVSCAEKIKRWNATHPPVVSDVQATVFFYNELASKAAINCQYFPGTKQLLKKTQELDCLNFITSAIDQEVLDIWGQSDQAWHILPFLTEILGHQSDDFSKGRGHFNYVRENYDIDRIIYVADAIAEIADGFRHREEFGIAPIGFANLVDPDAVARAFDEVLDACMSITDLPEGDLAAYTLVFDKLNLPDQNAIESSLKKAGAEHVVNGAADDLMGNLNLLLARKFL